MAKSGSKVIIPAIEISLEWSEDEDTGELHFYPSISAHEGKFFCGSIVLPDVESLRYLEEAITRFRKEMESDEEVDRAARGSDGRRGDSI